MEREMATSFYSEEELQQMGFAHVGHDVMISRKASIYGASNIWIGNHVRVDDFCVLSGKITFGNYIHVAVTTTLFGGTAGITFEDYTGISSHCAVYAASDDYSGDFMTNPTVPEKFTNVIEEPVVIKKYSNIGAGCIIYFTISNSYKVRGKGYYYAYQQNSKVNLRVKEDRLVNQTTTHHRISTSSGSSGGHSSSHSGRSTTHTSSSGRSHGGGSRKF